MPRSPRCLYYAFGGGLGHAVRATALARQLARSWPGPHRLLVNTPFAATIRPEIDRHPRLECAELSPGAGPAEAGRFVSSVMADFAPELLIVDTFPRGLGGELASLLSEAAEFPRVLIGRGLPDAYVQRYALAEFVRDHYDLAIAPGEPSPFGSTLPVHRTGPFLLRDFDELPTRAGAAELLRTSPDRPVVLVVGSGTIAECDEVADLARRLRASWDAKWPPLRLALPAPGERGRREPGPPIVSHFPLIECLPAVRLAIGAGGYNLVHETSSLSVPGLFLTRSRKYDDQAHRVRAKPHFATESELPDALRDALAHEPPPTPTPYRNGAADAARLITSHVTRTPDACQMVSGRVSSL